MKKPAELVIGLMSGTSLDGLDICLSHFGFRGTELGHEILAAETIAYPEEWVKKLKAAETCGGGELMRLHAEYGKFLGEQVKTFLKRNTNGQPQLVASHGHTIFHRPDLGYTFQLGSGAALSAVCGLPVVCDFRSKKVALGEQGAPLAPIGDAALFFNREIASCLNLGGFANISFSENFKLGPFDICPVNYVLNKLAQREGKNYDAEGKISASGKIIPELLAQLNALPYYKKPAPKSLGREWVEETIFPLLSEKEKTEDLLRTFTEHAAGQIAAHAQHEGKMLVTGGGAHNDFFISRLKEKCKMEIVIPGKLIVDFKEAHIFAYFGWKTWNDEEGLGCVYF